MSFYHAGTLFSPGESERRVSRPLAVQSDVCVHIHCNRPGLHYQYGANWKKIAIRSPNEQQKGSYQSQSQCALQRQKAKSIRAKQKYNNYTYILCKRYKNKIVFNPNFKKLIDSAHRRPDKHFKAYLHCFGSFCTNFKIPFLVFKVYKSTCPCIRRPLKMLLFYELGMPRRVSGSSLLSVPQSKTTNM